MVKKNEIPEMQKDTMSLELSKTNGQTPAEIESIKSAFKATGFEKDDPAMNTLVPIFNALVERGSTEARKPLKRQKR